MEKFFNTTGPCHPDRHYMLPAQARCQGLPKLIDQAHYFIIHAARQSGKTTLLLDLAKQLNNGGGYYALYCSLESLQEITEAEKGIIAILDNLRTQIRFHPQLRQFHFETENTAPTVALREALSWFCNSLDKPLVILFDEVDCLHNGTLITFLRQLREGYINRGHIPFVHAVALVGMRNIRDFKAKVRDDSDTLGSASPFNITKVSATLRNFTAGEIAELYAQHTTATGQAFTTEMVERVWQATQGQPWLVNAIAAEITEQSMETNSNTHTMDTEWVEQAVKNIILRRDTHIDSLLERLKESRVQRVIEPMILGNNNGYDWLDDDYRYALDLGLIRERDNKLEPANPIYGEVIIRVLSFQSKSALDNLASLAPAPSYLNKGVLNMRRLLEDFQAFWRVNSESWIERYQYKEAAPHLILHAFFYRVINGGGRISREMALGNGRLDLCLHYQGHDYPVELKLRYGEDTYTEGRAQLAAYMDKLGCEEGWLVVFDRRTTLDWQDKLFWHSDDVAGKRVHVVGC